VEKGTRCDEVQLLGTDEARRSSLLYCLAASIFLTRSGTASKRSAEGGESVLGR